MSQVELTLPPGQPQRRRDGRLLFTNPEPDPTIRKPVGPITLTVGDVRADPTGRCGADCLQPACSPTDCQLILQGNGFAPNAQLRVILRSDPVELGTVTTDDHGNLDVTLAVPSVVPDGEHVVELTGVADGVEQVAATPVVIERKLLIENPPSVQPTATHRRHRRRPAQHRPRRRAAPFRRAPAWPVPEPTSPSSPPAAWSPSPWSSGRAGGPTPPLRRTLNPCSADGHLVRRPSILRVTTIAGVRLSPG